MDGILRDIAIGLVVLYLGLAGVVSGAVELGSRVAGWRAANLWTWVRKTVDPQPGTGVKSGAGKWLYGKNATGTNSAVGSNAKQLEDEVRKLLVLPSKRVNAIPKQDFGRAAVAVLIGDAQEKSAFDDAITTVTAWSDGIPIKNPLLHILREAEGKREVVVDRLGDWFDGQMERLGTLYRRNMKFVSLACGVVIAVVFNINALNAFDVLHGDAALRSTGVKAGDAIVAKCDEETDPTKQRACIDEASKTFFSSKDLVELWGLFDDDDHGRRFQGRPWPPLGIAMSAGAIAMGAPFWMNTLKKLTAKKT